MQDMDPKPEAAHPPSPAAQAAPAGGPSAIEPPFTLTRSMSAPIDRAQAITALAKASFTSNRSTSSISMPAL